MAIINDGNAVDSLNALDLGQERGMIGRVEIGKAGGDIGFGWLFPVLPDRDAVKVRFRNETGGVLPG